MSVSEWFAISRWSFVRRVCTGGSDSLFLAGQVLFKHVFSAAVKLEQEESHAKIDIDKIKR